MTDVEYDQKGAIDGITPRDDPSAPVLPSEAAEHADQAAFTTAILAALRARILELENSPDAGRKSKYTLFHD